MDSVHGSPSRRRHNRESETESQKMKREKAAERQRRKRERDRKNAAAIQQQQQQQQAQAQAAAAAAVQHVLQPPPTVPQSISQVHQPPSLSAHESDEQTDQYVPELTPEEAARRERVRAAARDRQRKHRALVKQRRMRELGLDMGNEILPGMEEVHYRAAADGQYHQVLPQDLHQLAPPPHAPIPPNEPPFPQGAPIGGQTFASTLLLSFSCAPLLKQHLMRTLAMSNEELASLEPIIAEAWDHWDHQRRLHYAEVAKNGGQVPNLPPPPYALEINDAQGSAFPGTNGAGPADSSSQQAAQVQAAQAAAANDFRARFHRSIIAPTPFQTTSSTTASSTSGSAPVEGTIDPHLASGSGPSNVQNGTTTTNGVAKTEIH